MASLNSISSNTYKYLLSALAGSAIYGTIGLIGAEIGDEPENRWKYFGYGAVGGAMVGPFLVFLHNAA